MYEKSIRDRFTVIEPLIRTGDVLDVGCVDARPEREQSVVRLERKPDVLFRRICEANPKTLGLDIDTEGVDVLNGLGYQVVCGDVETVDLGRRFDTIVAGEIIEHLENPGLFLRNMRRHLKPEGKMVVSTPNPFYTGQTWKIWRHGVPMVHEGHLGWQDPTTMNQLLLRTGFDVIEGTWIQPETKWIKTWKRLLRPYFAHSFLVVAQQAADVSAKDAIPAGHSSDECPTQPAMRIGA